MSWGSIIGGGLLSAGALAIAWQVVGFFAGGVATFNLNNIWDLFWGLLFDGRRREPYDPHPDLINFPRDAAPLGYWVVVTFTAALAFFAAVLAYSAFQGKMG